MEIIYKHQVQTVVTTLQIPKGAKFLSVEMQNNIITMWMLVDKNKKLEDRTFVIRATGEDFDSFNHHFLGTVMHNSFVWHIFEITDKKPWFGWDLAKDE